MIIDDSKSHVIPVTFNSLSNAIASNFDLGSIQLTSQPFKAQAIGAEFDGGLFAGSMFLGFTYVMIVLSQGMELIYDREVLL